MLNEKSFSRIGILGDIHTSEERLEWALDHLHVALRCDLILCVGDIVDGPDDAEACCEMLREDPLVYAVCGNHDRWCLSGHRREAPNATPRHALSEASRVYLQSLPSHRLFQTPRGALLLFHGDTLDKPAWQELYGGTAETEGRSSLDLTQTTPQDPQLCSLLERWSSEQLRFLVLGHKHRRLLRRLGDTLIINPGAFRHGGTYDVGFCFLDISAALVHFFDMPRVDQIQPSSVYPLHP